MHYVGIYATQTIVLFHQKTVKLLIKFYYKYQINNSVGDRVNLVGYTLR